MAVIDLGVQRRDAFVADEAFDWDRIVEPDVRLHIETREQPLSAATVAAWLADAPKALRVEAAIHDLSAALSGLEDDLRADIAGLGRRFARLMRVDAIRVRVESLTGDSCTRMHGDYTDVRLITTYAGPGTDYVSDDDPHAPPARLPIGAIGLFKGHLFAPDHPPCLHRSPVISSTGARRLMLVIDTPLRDL